MNNLNHSTINRTTVFGRPAWICVALALGVAASLLLVLSTTPKASAAPDGPEKVFALTSDDRLLKFDADEPRDVSRKRITGRVGGESLVGIDFRPSAQAPATAQQRKLYAIGDQGYIYTINPKTAVATRGMRITADGQPFALRGNSFGIDFNPTVDRLRIVSDADQNLRINVDSGALADFDPNTAGIQPDRNLQYAAGDRNAGTNPAVGSVAYRNSQPSAFGGMTELYDIDATTDDMSEQDPPNNGTLNTEGPLNRSVRRFQGFDIVTVGASPAGDRGFAALKPMPRGSVAGFYTVNLNTGATMRIGRIGDGSDEIEGLAIPIGQR